MPGGYPDLFDDRGCGWPVTAETARAASRLTRARSLLAQTNSVARMARPIGMTTNAGPGKTNEQDREADHDDHQAPGLLEGVDDKTVRHREGAISRRRAS